MIENVELLKHDTVKIKTPRVIYIDPFKVEEGEKADLILITHEHYDHCSREDIEKLQKPETVVVTVADCQSKLREIRHVRVVKPGDTIEEMGVKITAVPAYNTNKPFHPKENEWVGFIVEANGKRIYHAGDTDLIPEMKNLGQIDVAFLPVSGTYVMTAEEAAQAAEIINAKISVPMHYGVIVGDRKDAERFKSLCERKGLPAEIL